MTRTFIQTHEFSRKWDELGFVDNDLRRIENDILENPDHYPIMRGTGGLQKARAAYENSGKSGGARACFIDIPTSETVYLITVFGKKEKVNLSFQERNQIKKVIEDLKRSLGG